MVRVGLFGAFEGEDALIAAVLRAELAPPCPGSSCDLHAVRRPRPTGIAERVSWSDQPLGACGAVRQEELAATLDAVVIAGTVPLDPARTRPERLLVEGLGPFEPEVPVVWFAVAPTGGPRRSGPTAREASRRASGLGRRSRCRGSGSPPSA